LRLFLDEVGNNGKDDACEDGTNDYQNDSQYREASHSMIKSSTAQNFETNAT